MLFFFLSCVTPADTSNVCRNVGAGARVLSVNLTRTQHTHVSVGENHGASASWRDPLPLEIGWYTGEGMVAECSAKRFRLHLMGGGRTASIARHVVLSSIARSVVLSACRRKSLSVCHSLSLKRSPPSVHMSLCCAVSSKPWFSGGGRCTCSDPLFSDVPCIVATKTRSAVAPRPIAAVPAISPCPV